MPAARPTDELARLAPLWRDIAVANDLPADRYILRVLPSDEINAFACGGHLVVVTTFAVDELPRRELAGVLAHELSHHLGLHTVGLTIGHWLSLPVVLLARIGFWLQNVATAATDTFARGSSALTMLGQLVAGLLNVLSLPFVVALYAADALGNVVAHRSEFQADRRVVRMGYGRNLSHALRRVIEHGRRPAPGRLAGPPRRVAPAGPHPGRPHRRHAPPPGPLTRFSGARPAGRERAASETRSGDDVGDRRRRARGSGRRGRRRGRGRGGRR